jgi:hypothetical protein
MSLRAAVTDIWRLEDEKAVLLLKIRAGLIAGFAAGTPVLTKLLNARFADILFVSTGLLMQTGIKRALYFNLDVAFDFLGDCRGILTQDQSYRLKG